MPDYIYLLENRLSSDQQNALRLVREAARDAGMTVFLTGGAVRDLTSGSPVRDLDVTVQGNALKLKKPLEKAGGRFWGEHTPSGTLYFAFPNSVRMEISGARREEFPKPGKPVYHAASILEDLRRRDFTANAMALSLNEGSYGLLMDPLNGVADIEARQLRLVSNYGFLEEPSRLIRATRFAARLGWELEEKTKARYENAKEEGVVSVLSAFLKGYELEEIAHEEDGLKVLRALEAEGWMQQLFPAWASAKIDSGALDQLHGVVTQLQMQGVNPDASTAQMELLTAKLAPKDLAALKAAIARQGFVAEWNNLEADAKEFAKLLTAKEAAQPSATWKLFTRHNPQAVLWLGYTSKSAPVKEKFNNFFNVWPEARQKIPYALMIEMRITPELEGYQDLLREIFFGIIDGRLESEEQMRAFLEPHSPPAPPPPVSVRRSRSRKAKVKEEEEELEELPNTEDLEMEEGEEEADEEDEEDEDLEERPAAKAVKPAPAKASKADGPAAAVKPPAGSAPKSAEKSVKASEKAGTKAPAQPESKAASKAPAKPAAKSPAKPEPKAPAKAPAKASAHPAAKAPAKKAAPAKAAPAKAAAKAPAKPAAKAVAAKHAAHPAKKAAKATVKSKPAAKTAKPAHKPAAKAKPAKKAPPAKKKH
jgi:tRNA nucleotidyltransferase (CCA-adding enzyme)